MKLIIFKPDGGRKEIVLSGGRVYSVGRKAGASLRIPMPSVSREHCELLVKNGGVWVRDLGSSNGTFRNNDRITEATLGPGDYLRVGDLNMAVQVDGEPERIDPPPPSPPSPSAESSMMKTPPKAPAALEDSDDGDSLLESFGVDESSVIDVDIDLDDKEAPEL